ncbi:MAG: hypothetical protein PVH29_02115 [Candidatus Zixiibacteriota bacterium]
MDAPRTTAAGSSTNIPHQSPSRIKAAATAARTASSPTSYVAR